MESPLHVAGIDAERTRFRKCGAPKTLQRIRGRFEPAEQIYLRNSTNGTANPRAYHPGMRVFASLLALVPLSSVAQNSLQSKIAAIAKDARGTVSVSCTLPGTKLNCDLNPHNHAPMQSMYKLPLGDRYPKANVDVTLRDIVRLAVGQSDNGAEEVLIRLVGGPSAVQSYIHSLGISAFHLLYSERDLDRDENLQYEDWIEPAAAVQLLERLVNDPHEWTSCSF